MENLNVDTSGAGASGNGIVWLLRLEGLAVAVLSALLYARTGASWGVFAALWLVPDLGMLPYFVNPRLGAYGYNALHTYVVPGALVVAALVLPSARLLPYALIWFNHIGFDRFVGYGFKYANAFRINHLNVLRQTAVGADRQS